jgi:hypothetical protein
MVQSITTVLVVQQTSLVFVAARLDGTVSVMMGFFLVCEMMQFRSFTGNRKINQFYACLKYMLYVENVISGTCFNIIYLVESYPDIFGLGFLIILFPSVQLIRWIGNDGESNRYVTVS